MSMPAVLRMAEQSVEQDRLIRLRGMISSSGGDPSSILEGLHLVFSSKDWRKITNPKDQYGGAMTVRAYVESLGWTQDDLLRFVTQNKHRYEKPPFSDETRVAQMEELRAIVRGLISPLLDHGVNREDEPGVIINNSSVPSSQTVPPYILARLARDADPERNDDEEDRARKAEIREAVIKGAMSPHAGAIAAGYRKKLLQIPVDPDGAARSLLRHFRGESLRALIEALSEGGE